MVSSENEPVSYRVLIADDERYTIEMVRFLFDDDKYSVDLVTDGSHTIPLLQQKEFSVMGIDMNMPGMDGLTTIKMVRNFNQDLSIFIMTGAPDSESVATAVAKYNVFEVVDKPFDLDNFLATVDKGIELYKQKKNA